MPQLIGNAVHRSVELLYGTDALARSRSTASELLRIAPTRSCLTRRTASCEIRTVSRTRSSLVVKMLSTGCSHSKIRLRSRSTLLA